MYKKILIFLCLIIGASFFYCLSLYSKNHFPNKVTVEFASWGSESEIKILKPILEEFEKENPDIKVDFLHIPQNYFQKIHLLFASNTSPDVIFINNQYLPIYANAGVLEDLTQYSKDFNYDEYYDKSIEALSWNDKVYAVPRDVSNLVIFYNKDLFKKYHVAYPKSGWNFNDFLNTAVKLTDLPNVFGVSFEEDPLFYLPYLTSNGGDFENLIKTDQKSKVFSDKNSQEALEFYANLRNKYHVAPRKEESASATMAQMFLQGRIAMHLSGRWLVPKYRQEAKFDWDIVEFPKGKKGSIVPLDASGWAISKSSKHKEEAIRLIKFLASERSSEKFVSGGLIVPARKNVANSSVFLNEEKPKHANVFLSVINTSIPTSVSVDYREVLDSVKKRTEYIFNTPKL